MRRRAGPARWWTLTALLSCAIGLLPATASGTEVAPFNFAGENAMALFAHYDGCSTRMASVLPVDRRPRYGQGVTVEKRALITLTRWDYCHNGFSGRSGLVELAPGDFQVRGNLRLATLDTRVVLHDWDTGNAMASDLHLTWRASGEAARDKVSRDRYSLHTRYPDGSMLIYRQLGRLVVAVASGTVSDGEYEYTAGHESIQATLASSKLGEVRIVR